MGVIYRDRQETTRKCLDIGKQLIPDTIYHSGDTDLVNAPLSAVNIVSRKVNGNIFVQ
jgi:hypothetical protein